MKFSKFNNPAKRKVRRSSQYVAERRNELYTLMAGAKNQKEQDLLIDAFDISIHPTGAGRR